MIPSSANNPSETTTTLETAKSLFDRWRRARLTTRGGKIPEYLWEEVRRLTKQYTYRQITSELRISYQQLLSHLEPDFPEDSDVSSPVSSSPFVNVRLPLLESSPQPPKALSSSHAVLEIQGKDGMSLKATGIQPQDLIPLVQSFLNH